MESTADTPMARFSPQTAIGWLVAALAVGAMALDHLSGGDTIAFVATSAVALAFAAAIFGYLIPRTKANAASSTVPRSEVLSAASLLCSACRRSSSASRSSLAAAASRSAYWDVTATARAWPRRQS